MEESGDRPLDKLCDRQLRSLCKGGLIRHSRAPSLKISILVRTICVHIDLTMLLIKLIVTELYIIAVWSKLMKVFDVFKWLEITLLALLSLGSIARNDDGISIIKLTQHLHSPFCFGVKHKAGLEPASIPITVNMIRSHGRYLCRGGA